MTERAILCPWCTKQFRDLSARWHHSRASHTGKDLSLVASDVIGGEQVARFQSIGDVVRPVVERAVDETKEGPPL